MLQILVGFDCSNLVRSSITSIFAVIYHWSITVGLSLRFRQRLLSRLNSSQGIVRRKVWCPVFAHRVIVVIDLCGYPARTPSLRVSIILYYKCDLPFWYIAVRGYVFNNVVCISGFIQFLSQNFLCMLFKEAGKDRWK